MEAYVGGLVPSLTNGPSLLQDKRDEAQDATGASSSGEKVTVVVDDSSGEKLNMAADDLYGTYNAPAFFDTSAWRPSN